MQFASTSTQKRPLALLWDAHNRAWVAGVLQGGCSSGVRPLATAAMAQEASPAAEMSVDARSKRATRVPRKKRDVMTVSEAAAKRIKELVEEKDPQPHGIRLGVRTRG